MTGPSGASRVPEVRELGSGVWAWMPPFAGWGHTNIGLVAGDGGALLIDTPWDLDRARSVLDGLGPRLGATPLTTVFNTHCDGDHWWGNAAVPGAEIVTSETTLAAMRAEPGPGEVNRLRRLASITGRVPGRAGRMGRYVATMLDPFAFERVQLRLPERTFSGRREETVGGRDVVFIELGGAHSPSDAVVLVPDARVVFCGDLLFAQATPIMWHGPPAAWMTAIEAITALEADTFVSGHGVLSTRTELEALHRYWSWLADGVATHRAAGRSVSETVRRLTAAPEFAAFSGWDSPERLYVNVATTARRLDGKGPMPTDPVTRTRLFDGIAGLADHLAGR